MSVLPASRVAVARRASRLVGLLALTLLGTLLPTTAAVAAPPTVQFTATIDDTNRVTLTWSVTGGESNLVYIYGPEPTSMLVTKENVGFKSLDCLPGAPNGCSHTFRVVKPGTYRYTISVRSTTGETATVTREVTVAPLPRPQLTHPNWVHVSMYAVAPQQLSWTVPGAGATSHVRLQPPGSFLPEGTPRPVTGSITVPVEQLGDWAVVHCVQPVVGQLPLCSHPTQARFLVGPAEITSPFRQVVQEGQPVTVTWTASGNAWHVSAPTLGIAQWTTTPSFTIPAASVATGVHTITVVTCQWNVGCSNREDVRAPIAGTVHHLAADQSVHWGGVVAEVTPSGGGSVSSLSGPLGTYHHAVTDGATVAAGDLVGFVITGRGDTSQLVVGGPSSDAFATRSLATDFTIQHVDASGRSSIGAPLDITYDSAGDIWSVGEGSTGVAQVDGGQLTHHEAPYALVRNPMTSVLERTRPFGGLLGSALGSASGLTERVVDTGTAVWWIQGGSDGQDNHSRLIRLDRTVTDNPATVADERLCAVHVPGDDNQVWGLAYDPATNRVWFSEQPTSGQAAVSWFVDGTVPCSNQLIYDRWEQQTVDNVTRWVNVANRDVVMATGEANRCTATRTTNCIHRIPLDGIGSPGPLLIHGPDLWIVSFTGSHVSRLPASATSAAGLVRYPLPQAVRGSWFAGFPWQIRADADAVYLIEFQDNQLLRLDRVRATADAGGECTIATGPTRPSNPCITELTLPMGTENLAGHSVALQGGRLWFTVGSLGRLSPPSGDAAYLGYVDTASWAAGDPTGAIYPVAPLGPAPDRMHRSLGGIEVRADGQIAVADYGGEILVLTPR